MQKRNKHGSLVMNAAWRKRKSEFNETCEAYRGRTRQWHQQARDNQPTAKEEEKNHGEDRQ
jgi:hypothetical protein